MKKFILTTCVFVLCVACGLGLTACSVGEVKENTSAVIETSTGIIPVEYSQGIATNLLQTALTNLNSCSYCITLEQRNLFAGALQDVDSPGFIDKYTYINDYGKNEVYIERFNESGISVRRDVVKVLKNAENQSKYYMINVNDLKYTDQNIAGGNATFSFLINRVTDGMCYNGISYINCYMEESSSQKFYAEVQIKDGLIKSIMFTYRDADTMSIKSQSIFNFSYENIERNDSLPNTVEALERMGYQLEA